ncbi:hypothetical protein DVS28_a0698 [Euzebya pacifica]|uniref:Uncharacterized protein n=1 Tax=Euzebya pacifica TaxID=1608957 RepID=A0A346XT52_9ACTN|nr:hypothetical protein [Euzebya pacifica]AXV05399.1 hypothetical protein DVS28_a0698 [Euzebya pacifica]
MIVATALLNLLMAVIYMAIGTMIAMDLERAIRRRGWSHFGVAWLSIMYTCGAHHLVHGIHVLAEGREVGPADLVAVAMGIPAGGLWALLRIEASRGGRGDRYVRGTPTWLRVVAGAHLVAAGATLVVGLRLLTGATDLDTRLIPNILLVGLYLGIGAALMRGQLHNRREHGGWSLSGLSLMMIFPTCAVMHASYVVYAGSALFAPDFHGLWVDWLGVPAALYFFWVVRGLETGTVKDWNERFESIEDLGDRAAASSADAAPDGPVLEEAIR